MFPVSTIPGVSTFIVMLFVGVCSWFMHPVSKPVSIISSVRLVIALCFVFIYFVPFPLLILRRQLDTAKSVPNRLINSICGPSPILYAI